MKTDPMLSHYVEQVKALQEQNDALRAQKAELLGALKDVTQWTSDCDDCEGTGIDARMPDNACRSCGGYGFNPSGDIREAILDARDTIQKEGKS